MEVMDNRLNHTIVRHCGIGQLARVPNENTYQGDWLWMKMNCGLKFEGNAWLNPLIWRNL
jgi:hypothetical protein